MRVHMCVYMRMLVYMCIHVHVYACAIINYHISMGNHAVAQLCELNWRCMSSHLITYVCASVILE